MSEPCPRCGEGGWSWPLAIFAFALAIAAHACLDTGDNRERRWVGVGLAIWSGQVIGRRCRL